MNAWTTVCLAIGAVYAFIGRQAMNPDGLSYLEMGQTALRVGPRGLANGYWSPGYPALIAAAFGLARPGIAAEFPLVHALNFAILVATVFVFRGLLRSWIDEPRSASEDTTSARALVPIGFGIFVLIALTSVNPVLVSPDLAVLGTTLLIALAYQRLRTSASWWAACALGASCALGYWMKTVMFPMGAMLLCLLFILPPPIERARAKLIAAGAVWLLVCSPVITLVSAKVGRPSYGETGHLNYAKYVLETGDLAGIRRARVVLAAPRVIEFGAPVVGTFPLSYDPAYWAEGTTTHFDLRAQVRMLASNAVFYAHNWLGDYQGVVVMLIALVVIRGTRPRDNSNPRVDVLLLWGIGWLALYAAVHVEPRLTAPAVLMISLSILRASLSGAPSAAAMRVSIVAAAFVLLKSASVGITGLSEVRNTQRPTYLELADSLRAIGLTPDTRIATIGLDDGFRAYYAHAAGLRVSAGVLDSTGPSVTGTRLDRVKAALAQAGVRAIVRPHGPVDPSDTAWQSIKLSDGTVAGVAFTQLR